MPSRHIALICLLSMVLAFVTACDSGGTPAGKPSRPVPIGDHAALQRLAAAYKQLAAKFSDSPMDMPPDERKPFVEQVFINAGYSYAATLHELATHKVDYTNQDVLDLVDLLTLPHRNITSLDDAKYLYSPQEFKDIKVIEDHATR